MAELHALRMGLYVAILCDVKKIIVQTDSKYVHSCFLRGKAAQWQQLPLVSDILDLAGRFDQLEVLCFYREQNEVADQIVEFATDPSFVEEQLSFDVNYELGVLGFPFMVWDFCLPWLTSTILLDLSNSRPPRVVANNEATM